jgi:hypothetical protein
MKHPASKEDDPSATPVPDVIEEEERDKERDKEMKRNKKVLSV